MVNPYHVVEEYTFDIEDDTLAALSLTDKDVDRVAVLCIARRENETVYANLRSPLLINTEKGRFLQVVLPNEGYPISAPLVKKSLTGFFSDSPLKYLHYLSITLSWKERR